MQRSVVSTVVFLKECRD